MKTVTIRLDDELHKEMKIRMAEDEKTLQDYIVNLIRRNMADWRMEKE